MFRRLLVHVGRIKIVLLNVLYLLTATANKSFTMVISNLLYHDAILRYFNEF